MLPVAKYTKSYIENTIYELFEKDRDIHIFKVTDDVLFLLKKTKFDNNIINLPFKNILLDIKIISDKYNIIYHKIYCNQKNNKIEFIFYYEIDGYSAIGCVLVEQNLKNPKIMKLGRVCEEGLTDKEALNKFKNIHMKEGNDPLEETQKMNYSENFALKIVGNLLNYINSTDVEWVTIEKTEKQQLKRIKRGKKRQQPTTFIRLFGKTKLYIDKIKEKGFFKYSHSFWVRGHWRVLKSEKYKENIGKYIWVLPFIKGNGKLIKKKYLI